MPVVSVIMGIYNEKESLKQAMEQMAMDKTTIMGDKARAYVESHFDSRVLCERILERKRELLRG